MAVPARSEGSRGPAGAYVHPCALPHTGFPLPPTLPGRLGHHVPLQLTVRGLSFVNIFTVFPSLFPWAGPAWSWWHHQLLMGVKEESRETLTRSARAPPRLGKAPPRLSAHCLGLGGCPWMWSPCAGSVSLVPEAWWVSAQTRWCGPAPVRCCQS